MAYDPNFPATPTIPAGDDPSRTRTAYDPYSLYGLQAASGLLQKNQQQDFQYPEYVSAATSAPTQEQYFGYTPTAPLAQVSTPDYNLSAGDYKGLMGGDYNAFQQALQTPGEISAKTAYNQGYTNLQDVMGGKGLYGSSMMANQATQGLDRTYQETLAKNAATAAATRYGMEQTDLQNLNQYNLSREQELNKYGAQMSELQRQQNADTWKAGATEADRSMQYGQGQMNWNQSFADQQRNWQNQQQYEKYTYDLAKQAEQKAYQENLMNQSLAIAGQGAPLVSSAQAAQTAAQNRNLQAQLAQQQADATSQAGWLGALGTLGGGLLGNSTTAGGLGTILSKL